MTYNYYALQCIFDCYAHDHTQGFYAVYGDVFRRIASEEAQYREAGATDDDHLPEFGMLF